MTCDDFRDSYELYSLGLLEPGEKAGLEAHLAEGCAACRRQIHEAFALKALLLTQAPEVVPPSRLRRRVLASVGVDGFSWTWLAAAVAAAMLVVTLWISLALRGQEQQLAQARQALVDRTAERDRLMQVFTFLQDPTTRQVNFGEPEQAPPRGHVYLNPDRGVLLVAANLPPLGAGQTYEMWVIPPGADAVPQPAGLFGSADDGTAVHVLSGPIDVAQIGAVAVSVEPAAGSAAPTTTPIIVAAPQA